MIVKIDPVDSFVREGFSKQMAAQFRCPAIFVSSNDKLRNLKTLFGNVQPSYPYIFLDEKSIAPNLQSYNPNRLSRQGIPVQLNTDNNQFSMARIIPVDMEVEVTFVTNLRSGMELDSVEGFARRWLFARRNGSVQFNVNYGMTKLQISYTLSDSIALPPRGDVAQQESVYEIVTTATVHGYISEPELGTRGNINQIQLADAHPVGGISSGSQFFKF